MALVSLIYAVLACAAPDEVHLGKNDGYPVCPRTSFEEQCLVGQYSHYDQVVPSRRIARGGTPSELPQAQGKHKVDFLGFLERNRNTGLLALKDGAIVFEGYQYDRRAENRFTSMSMAKTVVASLVGIALSEGAIESIDDLAEKYVPQLSGHPYGQTSLRHLLTMSSGVRFIERHDGFDDMAVLFARTIGQAGPGGVHTVMPFNERLHPPGQLWAYSSAETQVLGLVLRNAVGRPLADYLSEKIWKPMGAEADATWLIDAGGFEIAYCCINATLRDWGRLGMVFANGGKANGREIVPAKWLRTMTNAEAPHLQIGNVNGFFGYGYQTWLLPRAKRFALFGVRGQAILVDPQSKLVMVHTAVHRGYRHAPERLAQLQFWKEFASAYAD